MASGILLGLDVGTSAVKAAAFDARTGSPLAWAIRRIAIQSRSDGAQEIIAESLLAAVRRCARAIARQLPDRWNDLSAVGLAAQGGSACLLGRSNGQARTPMQLWTDTRALVLLPEIARQRPANYWRRLSFLDGPGAGLARLVWLRQRYPAAWDHEVLYGGAGECLYFSLTALWRQDAGNALQIGCYDARSERIASEPLSLVAAGIEHVAPMRRGHETHPLSEAGAKLLNCRPGIPVAGPYMDHEAGFLAGAASTGPDVLQCSLGTAWVGNFLHRRLPPPAGGFNLVLPAPIQRGSLIVRVPLAGNATLDWAVRTFVSRRQAAGRMRAEGILAERLVPPAGLVGLPWLTRPNPFTDAGGSGGFLGAGPHASREDLLRAFVSGLCFAFRQVFEPVVAAGSVHSVLLTGGASGSQAVRTLLAALLHPLPVRHGLASELAGAGGAVWIFQPAAARQPVRGVPLPSASAISEIRDAYDRFKSTCASLAAGLGAAREIGLGSFRRSPEK